MSMNLRLWMVGLAVAASSLFAPPLVAQTTVAGSTPGSFGVGPSGAGSYQVMLRTPPGVAGMEPKLALSQGIQGTGGWLGIGLQGLSIVHRCSKTIVQDGYTSGINYDANDRFCLNGERLVAISGTYGADGTEYRTERETYTR